MNSIAKSTSDGGETSNSGRKKSFNAIWSMMEMPRRSIGTLKRKFGKRQGRKVAKRSSVSDTVLLQAKKQRVAEKFNKNKSTISIKSQASSAISMVSQDKRSMPLTKWSRKLYGSDKAVLDERMKIMEADRFIIHPYSNFRMTWDILSSILIIMNVVIIPMDIAFTTVSDGYTFLISFKLISDVWFMTDVCLNFRTGVSVANGDATTIELNATKIAKRYLTTWFLVDLLASFPVDLVVDAFETTSTQSQAFSMLRIGKMLSLVRIARIPRLVRSVHQWEEVFNLQYDFAVSMLRLAYLIFIIMLICHWNGCLQYMVPRFYGYPSDTWVAMRGLNGPNVTFWEKYSWSLFKSTSQMLCIGYSQIIPQGLIDLWMTMFSQITGAILFAIFIGNAINLMEGMDASKNAYATKIGQGKLFDEKRILSNLSPVLRREIIWHNTAQLIQSVPLFENCSDDFVYALGEKLVYTVFMTGDEIVKEGEKAMHMFFISQGEVEVRSRDGNTKREFSDGAHFGEACLFKSGLRRSTSVFSMTTAHMYSLHRTDYAEVMTRYPECEDIIMDSFHKIRERSSRYDFIKRYNPSF